MPPHGSCCSSDVPAVAREEQAAPEGDCRTADTRNGRYSLLIVSLKFPRLMVYVNYRRFLHCS